MCVPGKIPTDCVMQSNNCQGDKVLGVVAEPKGLLTDHGMRVFLLSTSHAAKANTVKQINCQTNKTQLQKTHQALSVDTRLGHFCKEQSRHSHPRATSRWGTVSHFKGDW